MRHRLSFLPATVPVMCPHCYTTYPQVEVQFDECGAYCDYGAEPCNEDGCNVKLCPRCDKFRCDGCRLLYCLKHRVKDGVAEFCPECMRQVEANNKEKGA